MKRSWRVITWLTLFGLMSGLVSVAQPSQAQDQAPYVTLRGRAVLPADTFAAGPASGFAITGNTFGRKLPFASQPVQGVSSVIRKWNGNYIVLSDNGFGAKGNSADYRLRWYEMQPDFAKGSVQVLGYSELRDPDKLVPFPLVNGAGDRVLTGADFDPESFRQAPDGSFWYGDEFGPFLLHSDVTGRLIDAPIPMPVPESLKAYARQQSFITSPENPAFVSLPNQEARNAAANTGTSRGIEGLALNHSGTKLYPLLEGPLTDDPVRTRLLIQEFDLAGKRYTGKHWFYQLSSAQHAIGEMVALSDHTFLVVERDNGQGYEARFKRIYRIDLNQVQADGTLRKTLVADLMAITDDRGISRAEPGALGLGPIFTMPFWTIESVLPLDERTLLVIDDNNYPFSSGRRPGTALDDTEFVVLTLPQSLLR